MLFVLHWGCLRLAAHSLLEATVVFDAVATDFPMVGECSPGVLRIAAPPMAAMPLLSSSFLGDLLRVSTVQLHDDGIGFSSR